MTIIIDKQIHLTVALMTENPIYISIPYSFHDNIHHNSNRFFAMENREPIKYIMISKKAITRKYG